MRPKLDLRVGGVGAHQHHREVVGGRVLEQHGLRPVEVAPVLLESVDGVWEALCELPKHDPLHPDRPHWRRPQSQMLFEPTRKGGLGLPPAAGMLAAGIVATEHTCVCTGKGRRWIISFDELRRRHPALLDTTHVSGRM